MVTRLTADIPNSESYSAVLCHNSYAFLKMAFEFSVKPIKVRTATEEDERNADSERNRVLLLKMFC